MGKILEIFGKESAIHQSDVQSRIVEAELEESLSVEYKIVGKATSADEDLIEGVLIKPIVSFLNMGERQSSLLILGVFAKKHIPTDIEPVPELVLNAEKISSLIGSRIGSIPQFHSFPNYRLVPVKCSSKGFVYLIELDRWEQAAYFSRSTNLSYVRKADESVPLTIPEFTALADMARTSTASLEVAEAKVNTEATSGKSEYSLQLTCVNYGSRPATYVSGFLEVKVRKSEGVEVEVPDGFGDVTHLNKDRFRLYQFHVNQENKWPVYPGSRIVLGNAIIRSKALFTFEVRIETNDSDGKTSRRYRITPRGRVRPTFYDRRVWG